MLKILASLIILWASLATSARGETCAQDLGAGLESAEFVAYLNALLDEQILSLTDLATVAARIEAGESLQNSISIGRSTAERIHFRELENYLSQASVPRAELRDWIRAKIAGAKKLGNEREGARQATQHQQMHFIRIECTGAGGRMDEHTFEIMDTPVTQSMWLELMGENPSFHKNGGKMQPNHPVESVTWFSAAVFANRLSRKMGLKPYYDFMGNSFEGRAEAGTLALIDKTKKLKAWRFIFEDNFIPPLEEGYRLPLATENNWLERVLSQAEREYGAPQPWLTANSGGHTHPVAALDPLQISGQEIFDFHGNVSEWQSNEGMRGMAYGGNFKCEVRWAYDDDDINPSTQANDVGFRLIRSVK